MLHDAAGSITFAPPDCFMSVTCALREPPFNCEENRAPVLVLPVVRCSQSIVSTLPTKGGRAFTPPSLEVVLYGSVSAPCQVERLVPKKIGIFLSHCCQVVVHKGLCDCWTMYYCRLISNTKHFLVVPLSNFDSPTC